MSKEKTEKSTAQKIAELKIEQEKLLQENPNLPRFRGAIGLVQKETEKTSEVVKKRRNFRAV
ncbi:MAG: hypothetical protein JW812_00580 [Alphaproteobacteria bacterium]|nr:hypothetical protein [Alphaproteobacteria bacterium]MBN2779704.1 hypothetical protein [Alphaproteobacteria bacterium]